jgi:hypothetical protein
VKNQDNSTFRRRVLSGHEDERTSGDPPSKIVFGLSLDDDNSRTQVKQQEWRFSTLKRYSAEVRPDEMGQSGSRRTLR